MSTTKASDLILPKLDDVNKKLEALNLLMVTQFAQVHEELEAMKEKLAAAPKKPSTRSGTSKATQQVSPSGKKPYTNKMLWWKDMFAAHYDQFVLELFTPELESDGFIAEAEAAMQDAKNKDKVGEARYKAMADYIWKTKIKEDGCKKFKDAVFKKFDNQKGSSDGEEATKESTNDDAKTDDKVPNDAEQESDNAATDAEEAGDDGDSNAEGDDDAAPKAPAKKGAKAATPAKAPPKPAAKGPAKGAAKGATKNTTKTVTKAKK